MTRKNGRKSAPEWMIWDEFLWNFPHALQVWCEDVGISFVDHTDEEIILDPQETDSFVTWTENLPTMEQSAFLQPIFDIGFSRITWLAIESWAEKSDFFKGRKWRTCRYATLMTQGNWCRVCGARPPDAQLHIDHIVPRSIDPLRCWDLDNLQVMCRDCNIGKGNKDSIDWRKPRLVSV